MGNLILETLYYFYRVKGMNKNIKVPAIIIFILFMGNALIPSVLSFEQPNDHFEDSITLERPSTVIPSSSTNYYAIIAACSKYQNSDYNLPKKFFPPFSDAKLSVLYNSLLQSKNWNETHIILLLNDHATKQNITDALTYGRNRWTERHLPFLLVRPWY